MKAKLEIFNKSTTSALQLSIGMLFLFPPLVNSYTRPVGSQHVEAKSPFSSQHYWNFRVQYIL